MWEATLGAMLPSPHKRSPRDRRANADRRSGADRRSEGSAVLKLVPVERRTQGDRRKADRRAGPDRRRETPETHIRDALELLAGVTEAVEFDEEIQRDLDSAIFRLRFALDRLEHLEP